MPLLPLALLIPAKETFLQVWKGTETMSIKGDFSFRDNTGPHIHMYQLVGF